MTREKHGRDVGETQREHTKTLMNDMHREREGETDLICKLVSSLVYYGKVPSSKLSSHLTPTHKFVRESQKETNAQG